MKPVSRTIAVRAYRATVAKLTVILLLASVVPVLFPAPAEAANIVQVTGFGSNPGNLKMFKYIPAGLPSNAPLVVMMHGCNTGASQYDDESGWVKYADLYKFALVFPEQQQANESFRCFRYYNPSHNTRGNGDALSIKQMVDWMQTNHSVDPQRTFVNGLSGGGFFTYVMLATYPDVFEAGAVHAGGPYKCPDGDQIPCLSPAYNRTPQTWGDMVRNAFPGYTGPWPKVSIWIGSADNYVDPQYLTEGMEEWTNVHGIDQTADVSDTVKTYPHKVYKNGSGTALVETYSITGMAHAIAIDPGSAADQCGVVTNGITADANICAVYFIAKWFGLDVSGSDTTLPTVNLTAPTNGANVSGTSVSVTATASDNVGVTQVQFFVDGTSIGTDTTSPYSVSWNSTTVPNGSHAISATASDAAGNTATDNDTSVTVNNETTPPTVNVTAPTNGATVSGTVEITATASDNVGVTQVQFFVDNVSIGADTTSPYSVSWNSASVTNASHAIKATASDAAGNTASDNDTSVTVFNDIGPGTYSETFSDADASGDLFDSPGWTTEWAAHADDHSPTVSQSSRGLASSGGGCQTGWKTKSMSRSVTLGASPVLDYWRKLNFVANVNIWASARFRVYIDSTVVDERVVTYGTATESAWTEKAGINLATWANSTRTLKFEAAATSNVCVAVTSEVWVDDVTITGTPGDATAPTVNVTAPTNGATVGGAVTVNATASDNVGVTQVEFFVDGGSIGTDATSPYSVVWNSDTVANGSHAIKATASDGAGNSASDNDTSVTVSNGGSAQTVTFSSIDGDDQYVAANSDGSSPQVGSQEGMYGLMIGRDQYVSKYERAFLSFDTSSIPDTATISRVFLTVTHSTSSGNPWTNPAGNSLVIDIKNGCFGAACTTDTDDWASSPTSSAVATIAQFTSGSKNSADFSTAGKSAINKTGKSQLKLRFSSFQTATNYLFIQKGAGSTLVVEYT